MGGSSGAAGSSTGGASTGGSSASGYPRPCADIYDPDIVPTFEVEIAPEELALMEQDCSLEIKEYRPVTFHYGDETASAMMRLKGNYSFRCDKKQFVISFNETNSKGRFHGLRKIVLDAPWYDQSLLAERMGFSFMQRAGNYWSCVNNARLFINGQYYGAYANVERLDKEYLQRHFPKDEANGNLYEGMDELKTNEEVNDTSRRDALLAAQSIAEISTLSDLDEAVKDWASLAMLPDIDSYWAGVPINVYLYDHPTRGFVWFPYDMDFCLPQFPGDPIPYVNADPLTYRNGSWGYIPLVQRVLEDKHYCERFLQELTIARAAYDVELMTDQIDTWAAQIEDAVRTDPNKPYSMQEHEAAVALMKEFIRARAAFVDTWLKTATCPVTSWPKL